jgi:hypothetical protein
VRQLIASTLALALGLSAAFALVSCGGESDAKLLPGGTAREITENLSRIEQYTEEGECVGAEDAVGEVSDQVESLEGVDSKLVNALREGVVQLREVVASCEEETTESAPPPTEPPSTEEEERVPPGQEKKAEKEREKEERELEHEEKAEEHETPPAEEENEKPASPAPPPSEDEGGGTGAPGGVSPGTPAEPGDEG